MTQPIQPQNGNAGTTAQGAATGKGKVEPRPSDGAPFTMFMLQAELMATGQTANVLDKAAGQGQTAVVPSPDGSILAGSDIAVRGRTGPVQVAMGAPQPSGQAAPVPSPAAGIAAIGPQARPTAQIQGPDGPIISQPVSPQPAAPAAAASKPAAATASASAPAPPPASPDPAMGQLGTQPVPTGPADRPSDTHLVVPAADTPGNASAAARLAAPVAQQVAHQIAPQLRHQMEQIRFDLYPVELGRVTVRLRMRETGAQLVIAVEKPAALEALRIGIGHLQSNLAQAGVEIESRSVSLQLAADGQSQEGGRGRDDQRPGTKDAQAQADLKPEDAHGRDDAPGALFL